MTHEPDIPEARDDPPDQPRGAHDAPLVLRVRAGDTAAFGELYDRWFDRVLDLANRVVRDESAAADIAQDAFLAAWRNLDSLEDVDAFGGWLLRIARNKALDRKRRDGRARPVDEDRLAVIERTHTRPEDTLGTIDDPARVAEDASYAALLWEAADALGERDRDVLDLQLRHGLSPAEVADVVGLNRNAANQLVHRVRNRLGTAIGARMLWRGGTPECAGLRTALAGADVARFDGDAVQVIDTHASKCEACASRKKLRLSPAQMFAAIPIATIPALKTKVAAALSMDGVPMHGSFASGGGSSSANEGPSTGGGASSDAAPTDTAPTAGGRGGRRRWPRTRRTLVGMGVVVAVILGLVTIGVAEISHEPRPIVTIDAGAGPSTTMHASSSTSSASSTTAPPSASTTVAISGGVVPPPTAPPATPPVHLPPPVVVAVPPVTVAGDGAPSATTRPPATTTLAPQATLALKPTGAPLRYLMTSAPVLTWHVTGAAKVHVYGSGVNAGGTSGNVTVCPGAQANAICGGMKAGSYVYALDAFDGGGNLVSHRTVALTIG
jgi:RNA polymerase sigma factor (sigma-70 family)